MLCRITHKGITFSSIEVATIAIVGYLVFLPLKTQPDLATMIMATFGFLAVFAHKTFRPRLDRLDYFVISLIIIITCISSLLSVDPGRSFRFMVYLCLNMFLLVLATAMISRKSLKIIAGFLGLMGVVHLITLLITSQLANPAAASSLIKQSQLATLIVPNDALVLGLCLPSLALVSLNNGFKSPIISFAGLTLYVALAVYTSYFLQSKVAILSLAAAVLSMTVAWIVLPMRENLGKHRITVMVSTFSLLLALCISAWYLGNQSTTRLSLWSVASTAHTSIPEVFLGAGPNTFLYNPNAIESEFDRGDLIIPWVHNMYLEAYYDQGLFGLMGLLALTIIPLVRAMKIQDRAISAVLIASIITFCLVALIEITLTRRFYFAFLAVMYGLSTAQTSEAVTCSKK